MRLELHSKKIIEKGGEDPVSTRVEIRVLCLEAEDRQGQPWTSLVEAFPLAPPVEVWPS